MRSTYYEIPGGMAGTDETVRHMHRLLKEGLKSNVIRILALDILRRSGIEARDWAGEVEAVYNWVADNIRYTRDPYKLEYIQSPEVVVRTKAGDCDDLSVLLAALLQVLGHKTRFKVIASRDPGEMNHVYVQVDVGGKWISLDPTVPGAPLGWESPIILNEKTYNLEGELYTQDYIEGLGAAPARGDVTVPAEIYMPQFEKAFRSELKESLARRQVSRPELETQLKYLMSPQGSEEMSPVHLEPAIKVISEAIRYIDATPEYSQSVTMRGLAGLDDLGFNLFKSIKKAVKGALPIVAGFIPGVGPLLQKGVTALTAGKGKAPAPAAAIVVKNPPSASATAPTVKINPPGASKPWYTNPLVIGGGVAAIAALIVLPRFLGGRRG
jgi:hypothetical protein